MRRCAAAAAGTCKRAAHMRQHAAGRTCDGERSKRGGRPLPAEAKRVRRHQRRTGSQRERGAAQHLKRPRPGAGRLRAAQLVYGAEAVFCCCQCRLRLAYCILHVGGRCCCCWRRGGGAAGGVAIAGGSDSGAVAAPGSRHVLAAAAAAGCAVAVLRCRVRIAVQRLVKLTVRTTAAVASACCAACAAAAAAVGSARHVKGRVCRRRRCLGAGAHDITTAAGSPVCCGAAAGCSVPASQAVRRQRQAATCCCGAGMVRCRALHGTPPLALLPCQCRPPSSQLLRCWPMLHAAQLATGCSCSCCGR